MSYCGLEVPRIYSLKNVGVTQSLLKTWMECPLNFLFHINRVRSSLGGGPANSTGFGTLFHHVLEKTYLQFAKNKTFPSETAIATWLDNFIEEFPDQVSEWHQRDAAVIEAMLPAYLAFYQSDFRNMQVLYVEKQLEAELDGCCLRSKIDLIFKSKGMTYSLDHKTKSRIDEETICKALSFDFQHQFYTYSIESKLGLVINGSYHNIIRNPGDKFDGEDYDGFKEKIKDNVRKNPKHYFKRFLVNFSEKDKAEYMEELRGIITDIKECMEGRREFKRNVTSCVGFGACQYLDACSTNSLLGYEFVNWFFAELELPEINNLPPEDYYGNSKASASRKSGRSARAKG